LHIQDFEVDAAFELGFLNGSTLRRSVEVAERWVLGRFNRVSTISLRMMEHLRNKGVAADQCVLFPNWADIGGGGQGSLRTEFGIAQDAVVALYSGNMGKKQGLELLAEAASLLRADRRLHFVFCGDGAGRRELIERCHGLQNVRFMGLQPAERLGELLAMADIHLLPQRADAADLVMPSKLTGMLASGRPVVATANVGTEIEVAVNGRGLVVRPGDAAAFAAAIVELADDPVRRRSLGAAGRKFAIENLDKEMVLRRFEDMTIKLVSKEVVEQSI